MKHGSGVRVDHHGYVCISPKIWRDVHYSVIGSCDLGVTPKVSTPLIRTRPITEWSLDVQLAEGVSYRIIGKAEEIQYTSPNKNI
ncbi:hypothetical protein FKM82_012800 [Ascaphus truei]